MILFCDNDILHKLAVCNLLDDAVEALEVTPKDVYVLPTAKHKFGVTGDRCKAERKYGREVFHCISRFLANASEIQKESPDELRQLEDVVNIDPSDAILITATAGYSDFLLATGDKRLLKALAANLCCRRIAERIARHVVCLEQIIKRSIQQFGFDHVKDKVVPAVDCDNALRAAFGSGLSATQENVMRTLDAYIIELRSLEIDMLSPL